MLSALGRLLPARLAPGWQRISPTAHYTGYVWASHGVGDPRLATTEGRLLYSLTGLVQTPVGLLGGPRLEHLLPRRPPRPPAARALPARPAPDHGPAAHRRDREPARRPGRRAGSRDEPPWT